MQSILINYLFTDMKEITIQDVREAIAYGHDCGVENLSDEQLLRSDFLNDLQMGNVRVANVWIELQRRHSIFLPVEVFKNMKDNTVGAFIDSVNKILAA